MVVSGVENTTSNRENLFRAIEAAYELGEFERVLLLYQFGLEGTPLEVVHFHEEVREVVFAAHANLGTAEVSEEVEEEPKRRIGFLPW